MNVYLTLVSNHRSNNCNFTWLQILGRVHLKTSLSFDCGGLSSDFSDVTFVFVVFIGAGNDDVRVDERQDGSYTMETVLTAVFAACLAALLTGFLAGYACARRCTKSEDDNLPYPDTEYEYFEQRHNMNA